MLESGLLQLLTRDIPLTAMIARRGEQTFTRRDFLENVSAWVNCLHEQRAQRIALFMRDGFEFASALFAIWASGKTAIIPGDALPETCKSLQARADAFAGDFPEQLHPLRKSAIMGSLTFPALDAEGLQLEVFTSGSTGEPIAIPKHLRQLAREVASLETLWGDKARGTIIRGTVSHQHIYGLLFRVLWPLSAGHVMDADSLPFAEDIAAAGWQHAFILVSSPAHLKRLHEGNDWHFVRANLRGIFSSGGPLPPDAAKQCAALLGQAPIEVYGSSETGGIAWRVRDRDGEVWQCMPDVLVKQNNKGLLSVHSPHLPDDKAFDTADRVRLHADGRFELLGRADRIAKIEEKRISLSAIEDRLRGAEGVSDARVLILEGTREQVAAVVALKSGFLAQAANQTRRALTQRLRDHLAQAFEPVALPRRWRFVADLPVNAQGKITQTALRQLFEDALPRPRLPDITLAHADATQIKERWRIQPDLFYFEGHFPDTPILPGVVQLNWAIERGRKHFPVTGRFLRLEALKFQQPIMPEYVLDVELNWNAEKHALSFAIHSASGSHSSGRIVFGGRA